MTNLVEKCTSTSQKKRFVSAEVLLNARGLSGAKVLLVCKYCRTREELSNEYLLFSIYMYLLANIGVDTAENERLKVWR